MYIKIYNNNDVCQILIIVDVYQNFNNSRCISKFITTMMYVKF